MLQMQEAKAAYCRAVTSPRFYKRWVVDDAQMELKRLQAQEQSIKDAEEERGKLLKFAQ